MMQQAVHLFVDPFEDSDCCRLRSRWSHEAARYLTDVEDQFLDIQNEVESYIAVL